MADVLRRVDDRVYRLEDRFVNLYVVDADRIVLVDSGTRSAEPAIRRGLKELGKEPADVASVLLTHHHVDHMGTAGVWRRDARASIAVSEDDAEVVAGREVRRGHGIGLGAKIALVFMGLFTRAMTPAPVEPDRRFAGKETFELEGLRLEVLPAPGHTRGSCAFRLQPEDVLFAGDAINGRRGSARPPVFVEDEHAARASFVRLRGLGARLILPGHGDPIPRS